MLLWIILSPLIGSALNGIFNRSKNSYISGGIASLAILASFIMSLMVFFQINEAEPLITQHVYDWFKSGSMAFQIKVPFLLEASKLTAIMLLVITGIGSLIHIYATGYMSHDESPWRFFSYLNLFVAAMLVLVLSGNLVGVFLGWEGVGLCSYLLIGFWHTDPLNTKAGMKAFITNRIGDLGFLFALFIAFSYFGTATISEIVSLHATVDNGIPQWVWMAFIIGIFWAATGKSAQIPLYVWLPDAMAGPTPVSALIHAATMVTSGIFVLCRLWPVLDALPQAQNVVFCIGMATAWLAALTALTQRDMKKILAYSTVSQLGFMFVAVGAGSPVAGLFHVVTHACFKALLFLTAGSVIHGMHDKKDVFEMGGLRSKMKMSHISYLVGCAAISGFPLMSGFFSKDMILAMVEARYGFLGYALLLGAAMLTAFYMFRSYTLAFWGEPRSDEAKKAHESPAIMYVPLLILALLSIVVGFFETPVVLGGIHQFTHALELSWYETGLRAFHPEVSHAMEWTLMIIATLCSLASAYYAFVKYRGFKKPTGELSFAEKVSYNKFYVDEAYERMIIKPFQFLGKKINYFLDEVVINGTLHAVVNVFRGSGRALSLLHTGSLQTYALYIVFGLALTIGVVVVCYL